MKLLPWVFHWGNRKQVTVIIHKNKSQLLESGYYKYLNRPIIYNFYYSASTQTYKTKKSNHLNVTDFYERGLLNPQSAITPVLHPDCQGLPQTPKYVTDTCRSRCTFFKSEKMGSNHKSAFPLIPNLANKVITLSFMK